MKKPHRTRESRLLERMRLLELRNEALETGVTALVPTIYLVELSTLAHIAHYGVNRREDSGYTSAAHPTSRPPAHNPEAQRALKIELHELSVRADRIRATLQQIDPGVKSTYDVETMTGGSMSPQTQSQIAS